MKDGPAFPITHTVLYQMCDDPEFYTQVPIFFFMRAMATDAVGKIIASVVDRGRGKKCVDCGDGTVKSIMKPVMVTFINQIKQLHETGEPGRQALQALVNYVSNRRGYRPRPISILYVEGGTIKSVDL